MSQALTPAIEWSKNGWGSRRIFEHRRTVITLARQGARNAVKADLRARNLKLGNLKFRDIAVLADEYLKEHSAELIAQAKELIERSPAFARRPDWQWLSLCKGHTQNGGVRDRRLRSCLNGGPTLDAQRAALAAAWPEHVYAEEISGAVTDRKALARAIRALGPGDVLLVTRLDRLARSTHDLLNPLDAIGKAGLASECSLTLGRTPPPRTAG